jgi:hypothetical protein
MKIWTMGYFPFTLGGDVHRPICCDVEVSGPHDLGFGYQGYVATSPNGRTFVAESETGAIVGPSLSDVINDISQGDPSIMRKQIEKAHETAKRAEELSPDRFWSLIKGV